jgi:folate-binding protein YgfZ
VPSPYPIHNRMSTARDAINDPQTTPNGSPDRSWGRLPHLGLLRFAGPDAISFLQGQVSNDTRRLSDGALACALCNPQGRVISVLHLLPHSSGIMAILPRELVATTLERLRKFILRAKVKIEDVTEQYAVIGVHGAAALEAAAGTPLSGARLAGSPLPADGTGYFEHEGTGIARVIPGAQGSIRYWVVRPASGAVSQPGAGGSGTGADLHAEQMEREWRLADIRAGSPQVYAATSEEFVAQMLNLDLIDAINFSKGCYTGQEIIARTQHLGRIKRRMFRLRLPAGRWAIGQALRLADGRTGRLTEIAPVGEAFEALAVLSLEAGMADDRSLSADTAPAVELPLPYGLASA